MEYMNDSISGCMTTKDIGLAVAAGLMPGYDKVDKFGVNRTITTSSDPEDLWEFGGEYIYDADGTDPIRYISSDSALDVGHTIGVEGLDINGNRVVQEAILDGQNVVTLETPLWRCFRMGNKSDYPMYVNGTVYVGIDPAPVLGRPANDDDVRAIINDVHGQTLMAIYTIPAGFVGYLTRGEFGVELEGNAGALAEYSHCHYETRRFGKTFRVKKAITCMIGGNAVYQDKRSFPDVIPAKTDIKLRVIEVSQTMGLWGTFDILLIPEKYHNKDFLEKIGQPE